MSFFLSADKVFEVGLAIQNNCLRFYQLAAQQCAHSEVCALCRELADGEMQHVAVFERLRRNLPVKAKEDDRLSTGGEATAYVEALAEGHFFSKEDNVEDLVAACTTVADLFSSALAFEKDSVRFYQAVKPLIPEAYGQTEIEHLLGDEMGHIGTLTTRARDWQLGFEVDLRTASAGDDPRVVSVTK